MATHIIQGNDGNSFLAMKREISQLSYDLSNSYLLSWVSKGHCMEPDSSLSMSITESGLIQGPHVRETYWEEEEHGGDEEALAIGTAFKSQAGRVAEGGVFIFIYHGPNLSADTIRRWLEGIDTALPQQMVLFLDFPSADKTAMSLTNPHTATRVEKMCIFSSHSTSSTSRLTVSLGVSLFTYLTSWAIRKCTPAAKTPPRRVLYLSKINRLVRECWMAIGSLCLSEKKDSSGPSMSSVTVQSLSSLLQHQMDGATEDTDGGGDEIDGSPSVARFRFVEKHYRVGKKTEDVKLCEVAYRWLDYLKHGDTSPLHTLNRHTLLSNNNMFLCVLRLLVYSLALIQETSDSRSTAEPNTLIVVYVQAVSVLEMITPSTAPPTSVEQFHSAAEAYCVALEMKGVSTSRVNELIKKVKQEDQ